MPQQEKIPVAANVLGTIGTVKVFWCVQLIPQIWTNWKTKSTEGLPAAMMFLWAVCGVPMGAYDIIQKFNVPLQVQPQVFMALALISFSQIVKYTYNWPTWRAALLGISLAGIFAGVEAALIVTLRPKYENGNEAASLVVGIIASILLALGLIPPYFEMYKRHGRVVGINFFFLGMDWCGAFFSLMALVAQSSFDILGGVLYIICAFLELGIFTSQLIWMLRTRHIRKQAKAEGKTFDDIIEEHRIAGQPFAFADRPLHPALESLSWWTGLFTGKKNNKVRPSDEEAPSFSEECSGTDNEPTVVETSKEQPIDMEKRR